MFAMGPGFVKSGGAGASSTWNPSDKNAGIALTNANLTAANTGGSAYGLVRSTSSKSAGKFYFEIHVDVAGASNFAVVGLCPSTTVLSGGYPGVDANGWGYYQQNGQKFHSGAGTAYGTAWALNDVIGVAVDLSSGLIWFSNNNVWQASGNPAAGTNPAYTGITGLLFPAIGLYGPNGGTFTARFLAASQTYAPPAGFSAWG
jgi:hypothetical protein